MTLLKNSDIIPRKKKQALRSKATALGDWVETKQKFALCLKHSIKVPEYRVLKDVDSTLLSLWKLFEYSSRQFAVFARVQEAYNKQPLTLIKATTTRYTVNIRVRLSQNCMTLWYLKFSVLILTLDIFFKVVIPWQCMQ